MRRHKSKGSYNSKQSSLLFIAVVSVGAEISWSVRLSYCATWFPAWKTICLVAVTGLNKKIKKKKKSHMGNSTYGTSHFLELAETLYSKQTTFHLRPCMEDLSSFTSGSSDCNSSLEHSDTDSKGPQPEKQKTTESQGRAPVWLFHQVFAVPKKFQRGGFRNRKWAPPGFQAVSETFGFAGIRKFSDEATSFTGWYPHFGILFFVKLKLFLKHHVL